MKEFGRKNFKYTAYFNFDATEELSREFENTKDPSRIIEVLKLYVEVPIIPGETLIIFDEIQQCNKALNSLKYFCEDAPQYHVMAAGSLLGVALSGGDSFPVGKVDFLNMYPISFREFLRVADRKIFDYVENIDRISSLPEIVNNRLTEVYRQYEICGGLPASASAMLEGNGIEKISNILQGLLDSYEFDFSKHAPTSQIPRIADIWNSIPSQLARENRKFVYKLVKPGARAREYEDSLLWLQQAGLIYKIFCCSRPGLPLKAYDDLSAFKIYMFDIGILRQLAKLPAEVFLQDNPLYREFKGAVTENYVLQSLIPECEVEPRYWVSNGTAEVDFLLQHSLSVIPAEVKAGTNTAGKSLSVYIGKYNPDLAIVFSGQQLALKDNVLYIPLTMACWTRRLISIALTK